jgi:hypothetical protein
VTSPYDSDGYDCVTKLDKNGFSKSGFDKNGFDKTDAIKMEKMFLVVLAACWLQKLISHV